LIAKIVSDPQTSPIAIGLATCIQNTALTFSPLIIAGISRVSDSYYYWEEVFFICCSSMSLVLVLILYRLNRRSNLNDSVL
jgi:hypothetical protein